MAEQLSYLEMADQSGRIVVANGVVSLHAAATLAAPRRASHAWMRIYRREPKVDGLPLDSLRALLAVAPNAIRKIIPRMERGGGVRFMTFDTFTHHVASFEPQTITSLDKALDLWGRVSNRDAVLVELSASAESLASMLNDASANASVTPPPDPPLPDDTDEARELRKALASEWISAAMVGEMLNSRAKNTAQLASRYRKEGLILGIWVRQKNRYLYPPWQFLNDGFRREMPELLQVLRDPNAVGGTWNGSGWEEATWFYAPHTQLDGKRPADVMPTAPWLVLDVARREFMDGPDARW